MYIFKEIFVYNLRLLLKNKWIYLFLFLNLLFFCIFSLDLILQAEQSPFTLIIHYVQQNFLYIFLVTLISVWVFSWYNSNKYANLIDTYSFSNWQLYLAIYLGLVILFTIYAIIQFVLIMGLRGLQTGEFIYLKSLPSYLIFVVPDILFYTAIAALFSSFFTNVFYSFLMAALLRFYDFSMYNFNSLYAAILNSSGFKYYTFSDFGVMGVFTKLFTFNRLFFLVCSLFLLTFGLLIFKRRRNSNLNKLVLVFTIVFFIVSGYCIRTYNIIQHPALTTLSYNYKLNVDKASQEEFNVTRETDSPGVLQINDYYIEGKTTTDSLELTASFVVKNKGDYPVDLYFNLNPLFSIQGIFINDRNYPYTLVGKDRVQIDKQLAPGAKLNCRVKYHGSPKEYGKSERNDLHYRLTAYVDKGFIFLPLHLTWYPQIKTDSGVLNQDNYSFTFDIQTEYPLVASSNFLYGFNGLEKKEVGGIDYVYYSLHEESIKAFHAEYKNWILFMEELIPDTEFTIYELPRNFYLPDNMAHRIFISEEYIIKAATNTLMELEKMIIKRDIFGAWFELKESSYAYFIYGLIDYIYQVKYNPDFNADGYVKSVSNDWNGSLIWENLIDYYKIKGLSACKELLRDLYRVSRGRDLSREDFAEFLGEGEDN